MSDSKRKSTGFQDSLSKGSTEDFDVCCNPCLLVGQHAEAKGFCKDCQENLCKTCLEYHNKLKATRYHKIQSQLQTGNVKTPVKHVKQDFSLSCTEQCQIHQTEVIKFFCPTHEVVGCTDCMTLDHRTCKLDYIPDICAGITKSHEFKKTLKDVAENIKRAVNLDKESKSVKRGNKTNHEEALRKFEVFQIKMNDRLEQLKRNMMQETQKERSLRDGNVDKVLHTADHVSTSLRTFQSALQDGQSKNLNAKAFVIMKQTQSMMKALNLESAEEELQLHRMKYVFEPNEDLEKILLTTNGFGKLVSYEKPIVLQKNKSIKSFILEKDINVRTKSDERPCIICGCVVISAVRILLTDTGNLKLKLYDFSQQSIIEEKTLDTCPFGIAVLQQNKVAVTTEEKILLFGISGKISEVGSIPIKPQCSYGIVYHQDRMYVVCHDPNSLLILDMQGTVHKYISLETALTETFIAPSDIAISNDGKTMYVTDCQQHFVAAITLKGEVTNVYQHIEMIGPRGLMVIPDGSLLICCSDSSTVHHVTSDLKHEISPTENVSKVMYICYQPENQKYLFGGMDCDSVKVVTIS